MEELSFALHPCSLRHVAEITRRQAVLSPGTLGWPSQRRVGFGDAPPPAGAAEALYHVYPWVPRVHNLHELYQVALGQRASLLLSVQLTPACLSAEQLAAIRASITRAERWLDANDRACTSDEERASRHAMTTLVAEKSDQLERLQDAAFAMRVRVASACPLRPAMVEAFAQSLTSPAAEGRLDAKSTFRGGAQWSGVTGIALARAARELSTLAPSPLESDQAQGPERALLGLVELFEAQAAFRLPVPDIEVTPGLRTRFARFTSAPDEVSALGVRLGVSTDAHGPREIRVATDDRRRHCYVVGQSGTGKSTLFSSMILEDIRNGSGVCVIDPHGDLIEDIVLRYPKQRAEDLIIFDAGDRERPVGLNPLEWHSPEEKSFLVQEMVAMIYRLFPRDMVGPMFERTMRNCLLTLMAMPVTEQGTLVEVPRLFLDREFHKRFLVHVKEPQVRMFWEQEFTKMTDHTRSEFLGYFVSKFERFVADPTMRNIVGQPESSMHFGDVMNQGKVLLLDLGKGSIGEINSSLLGMVIIAKLQAAAMARVGLPREHRRDFYVYVDEFQNFASATFTTLLSEARKFGLNLVLTNQYTSQLRRESARDDMLSAVLGNVGTLISMRVGSEDAPLLEKQFAPTFSEADLTSLPNWHAYVNLLVEGRRVRPFSMRTVKDPAAPDANLGQALRRLSALKFGRDSFLVEQEIRARLGG
jgi:hypothetical protein